MLQYIHTMWHLIRMEDLWGGALSGRSELKGLKSGWSRNMVADGSSILGMVLWLVDREGETEITA